MSESIHSWLSNLFTYDWTSSLGTIKAMIRMYKTVHILDLKKKWIIVLYSE